MTKQPKDAAPDGLNLTAQTDWKKVARYNLQFSSRREALEWFFSEPALGVRDSDNSRWPIVNYGRVIKLDR